MVSSSRCGQIHLPAVGVSPRRPVCNKVQQKLLAVLFPMGSHDRCVFTVMIRLTPLSFSTNPAHSRSIIKDKIVPRQSHTYSPTIGPSTLVVNSPGTVSETSSFTSPRLGPNFPRSWSLHLTARMRHGWILESSLAQKRFKRSC